MGEPQPVIWMTLRVWLKFSRKKQFCFPAAFFAPAYKFPACCPANGLQACPARSHNHISQFLGKEICVYVKVKATQSCLTLCNPMEFSRPWNSPGQMLNLVAVPFPRGSSQPRDQTQVSCLAAGFFTHWATREVHVFVGISVFLVELSLI